MLNYLHIRNVALIDELEIEFDEKLNILSGETGAGKSIIIDSINFVLGERPGKDFIRNGEDIAEVNVLITVSNQDARQDLLKTGIFDSNTLTATEDIFEILICRTHTRSGRSICKINGKTVTTAMLREVSSMLIDIHGQHEHQSLLNANKHIELLDRFCSEEIKQIKQHLIESVEKYKETVNRIKKASGEGMEDKDEKISIYTFQIQEIESANLKENEDNELADMRKMLTNFEKLSNSSDEIISIMQGGKKGGAVTDSLWNVYSYAKTIAEIDPKAKEILENIESICTQADDWVRGFNRYYDTLEHDPSEIERIEERLDLIYRLKRKYGQSIKEIIEHLQKTKLKLNLILDSEKIVKTLSEEKTKLGKDAIKYCSELSAIRKSAAEKLRLEITNVLSELGMKNAQFDISVDKKDGFGINGYDKVEFLISPNLGEPLKPLSKIASGGEMSRVMLALKTVLAEADSIESFIFDEIDTGVSGRTAQQVAEKLAFIGKSHQILCITHLPQIAAMGDANFLIEKSTDAENRTTTNMYRLDKNKIILELARLTGGAEITDSTIKATEEMKEQADILKENIRKK